MKRVVFVLGMILSVVLVFQTFMLPSRNAFPSLFPTFKIPVLDERSLPNKVTSPKPVMVGKLSLLSDSKNSTYSSGVLKEAQTDQVSNTTRETDNGIRIHGIDGDTGTDDTGLDQDGDPDDRFPFDLEDDPVIETIKDPDGDVLTRGQVVDEMNSTFLKGNESVSFPISSFPVVPNGLAHNEALVPLQNVSATENVNSTVTLVPLGKKKDRVMPPINSLEMNQLLLRNRAAYHSMRPRWSSVRDKEIIAVKAKVEKPPIVKNEQELYAPLFRNISMFKRSYELMERMLKVYIYNEGKKPIFHQPLLKGIYASEGWFMKLMESNRQFVVRDPRRAHLFYMPFSSRYLQFALYVPNSHNRRNLEQHLKDYVDLIAKKYPFWNRTGGADHFFVACHDWAPYETRHTMSRSIRALCNADLHGGFRLGKDVSVPETYVRSSRNPLRDLGGRPADRRPTLAFYAGNMHGTLRPVLVHHWENKDPAMKIFGPMPPGVKSKMTYIQHMKTSKYCICPRGYEVNSPRVVEAIFYECVPVLISDNYVPPFFEVLNWEAFSVTLREKDVPRLKEILESITEEQYLALQNGVKMVQQHFLWHSKPVKYDLFHMTLHSIWFNRVYQIRPR